jgi:hypothetical protein
MIALAWYIPMSIPSRVNDLCHSGSLTGSPPPGTRQVIIGIDHCHFHGNRAQQPPSYERAAPDLVSSATCIVEIEMRELHTTCELPRLRTLVEVLLRIAPPFRARFAVLCQCPLPAHAAIARPRSGLCCCVGCRLSTDSILFAFVHAGCRLCSRVLGFQNLTAPNKRLPHFRSLSSPFSPALHPPLSAASTSHCSSEAPPTSLR